MIIRQVVVVDDSISIRKQTRDMLVKRNYEVTTFEDGFPALKTLENSEIDLFLLDINMPELDGLSLCRLIRMSKLHATTPVFLLTSKQGQYERALAELFGANAYITKPYTENDVINAIESAKNATNDQ